MPKWTEKSGIDQTPEQCRKHVVRKENQGYYLQMGVQVKISGERLCKELDNNRGLNCCGEGETREAEDLSY